MVVSFLFQRHRNGDRSSQTVRLPDGNPHSLDPLVSTPRDVRSEAPGASDSAHGWTDGRAERGKLRPAKFRRFGEKISTGGDHLMKMAGGWTQSSEDSTCSNYRAESATRYLWVFLSMILDQPGVSNVTSTGGKRCCSTGVVPQVEHRAHAACAWWIGAAC